MLPVGLIGPQYCWLFHLTTGVASTPVKRVFIRKPVTYPGFNEKSKEITTKLIKADSVNKENKKKVELKADNSKSETLLTGLANRKNKEVTLTITKVIHLKLKGESRKIVIRNNITHKPTV